MTSGIFCFGPFRLDPVNRQFFRDDDTLDLGGRYFDALSLLVRHPGELMTKDQFMDQVWQGVPVTDEALTQCIRNLRRLIGDDAASPRYIETVPKHGYRFIAPVCHTVGKPIPAPVMASWSSTALVAGAGTIGGGMAGLVGGLVYGIAGVSRAPGEGDGISVLLVVLCLCILAGLLGGAGVSIGIAVSDRAPRSRGHLVIVGGALGGLAVGAAARLLGIDAFTLIFGHAPAHITGAMEGTLLGAATGAGVWLARRYGWLLVRSSAVAACLGASIGLLIYLLGGTLMAGSLNALSRSYHGSKLTMNGIARIFGEPVFGSLTRTITTVSEGLLFAVGTVAALLLARHVGEPNNR